MKRVVELLGYEKIKIVQDTDMFSFSLDSMLLANFASVGARTRRIMDLCSGNAPVPLYLTLRTDSPIIGVEIQKKAYDLAVESVKINNMEDQIKIILDDVKGISKKGYYQSCDLVTCNPPFFEYRSSSLTNKNDYLTIARHEVLINLEEIIKEAFMLLVDGGKFAMVHRPDRLLDILVLMKENGLEPKRLRLVYPKIGEEANHVLIEGIKNGKKGGLRILSPLFVYDGLEWTEEIKKIYNYQKE